MRKFLLVLLSAVVLLAASCSSWMKDDDFYSDIENDVKVANAEQISVYVRYAMTRQGSTDPDGPATFKVEIPHEISATTEPEYGFVRWAAFSTDFLATGDDQTKNKDVYFIDDEDYNTRLLPHEILAPTVEFDDPKNPTTTVTINEKRDDIFLVPIVAQRPAISLTIPAVGSSDVGKSKLVNQIIRRLSGVEKDVLTVSYAPNTTLNFVGFPLGDGTTIYDTPGVLNKHQYLRYLTKNSLKQAIPQKEIKAQVYQLDPEQTLFIGGLARFDFLSGDKCGKSNVVLYFSNNLLLYIQTNSLILFRQLVLHPSSYGNV